MIKEVLFFCFGDSSNASVWSNVPFCFSNSLENHGITVRRISLEPTKLFRKCFNRTIYALLKLFFPEHECRYERSVFFKIESEIKIRKAVKQHSSAELCIFTNFDFYNKFNQIPTLLFCDWTYDIYITERLKRKLYWFERRFAAQQAVAINKSNYVVSLFPNMALKMRKNYPAASIFHLERNVVNIFPGVSAYQSFVSIKYDKKKILFIGGPKYLSGLKSLIQAYSLLKKQGCNCSLDIIGINQCDVQCDAPEVSFYGYLNKSNQIERDEYYRILSEAYVVVNVQPLWAGYSSIIESMYFYTPVIVTPFEDFVSEFGKEIDFGIYSSKSDAETLSREIKGIYDMSIADYERMAIVAHKKVKDYTWDKYVEVMFEKINK